MEDPTVDNRGIEQETKAEKFKRLVTKRLTNAVKTIQLVGNCADEASYDYTDEQADTVIEVLEKEIDAVKAKFKGSEVAGEDPNPYNL